MLKKIITSLVATTLLSTTVYADFLGVEVGYGVWNAKTTGDIRKGTDNIDFEDDLGFGSNKSNGFFYVLFDHPLPLIPNIKLQQTNFSTKADGKMSKNATFAGETFGLNDDVLTYLKLNQTDLVLYYRLLDNWLNLDTGLMIKSIDGNINIKSTSANANESFDVIIPMLHVRGQLDLPFSGLSAEAEINYIKYMGNNLSDVKVGVKYEFNSGFGLSAGYKAQKLEIDDINDIYGAVNNSGIYTGLYYHF
ncbi:MAG: TIGR04219 family outer membrane beta-barrel protein [Campylobacterota bacterium]|nr:TIGR04219 family outer membrane beta-barrel protein [Campylobacterota bacterium]